MNQELMDMAKEVDLLNETDEEYFVKVLRIEAFAALVAAVEREACAKACERLMGVHYEADQWESYKTAEVLAQSIRNRGETK